MPTIGTDVTGAWSVRLSVRTDTLHWVTSLFDLTFAEPIRYSPGNSTGAAAPTSVVLKSSPIIDRCRSEVVQLIVHLVPIVKLYGRPALMSVCSSGSPPLAFIWFSLICDSFGK